jgi:hypothetical protein
MIETIKGYRQTEKMTSLEYDQGYFLQGYFLQGYFLQEVFNFEDFQRIAATLREILQSL